MVTGSRDEFAPPDLVKKLVQTWNPDSTFEVINGADHFFFGSTENVTIVIEAYL